MVNVCVAYYMRSRTHLSLEKDSPIPRPLRPPTTGRIAALPEVTPYTIATTEPHSSDSWCQRPLAGGASTPKRATRARFPRLGFDSGALRPVFRALGLRRASRRYVK
jgi:hypothetical protein